LYRQPQLAAQTHRQHGPYIEVLHTADASETWNPSDYAFQLTRRPSGLPFWFTLLVHGTDALTEAVRSSIDTTAYAVRHLESIPDVDVLLDPDLTVVLFRKAGWDRSRWQQWSKHLLDHEIAFVAPTSWKGESVGRLVFLHPLTTNEIVDEVIDTLR
jgi:glutamate/tyrosine decarboxylase-like PLP-dependent enzyme